MKKIADVGRRVTVIDAKEFVFESIFGEFRVNCCLIKELLLRK